MATMHLSLIRSSTLPSLSFSSPIAASSLSGRCNPPSLPRCSGLRLQPTSVNRFPSRARSITAPRRGRVACEAGDTAVEVASVTDANWQTLVLESEFPVLVEFWAPWCGPCRMIHPIVDELAKQYAEKLKCYKVNTDESPSTATRYGIRSIPTVIIFKDGEKKDAVIGAVPKATLISSIEKFL